MAAACSRKAERSFCPSTFQVVRLRQSETTIPRIKRKNSPPANRACPRETFGKNGNLAERCRTFSGATFPPQVHLKVSGTVLQPMRLLGNQSSSADRQIVRLTTGPNVLLPEHRFFRRALISSSNRGIVKALSKKATPG